MSTAVSPMGPGDAMRRFFESISSGLVLPGMFGPMISFMLRIRYVYLVVGINGLFIYTLATSPINMQ